MTGTEIIELARTHFGELTANTVTADAALDYLNESLHELYEDLPAHRQKSNLTESTVTMTSNKGPIEADWDKIISVYVGDKPAIQVQGEIIHNSDYGTMFESALPIYYFDQTHLWVRPSGTIKVVHLDPPDVIASGDLGNAVTSFDAVWHEAIANLMASYMYAQEEDAAQAAHYRRAYHQKLSDLLTELTEEG